MKILIKDIEAGTIKGRITRVDLANGGVVLGPFSELIPKNVVSELFAIKEDIISGKIVVPIAR